MCRAEQGKSTQRRDDGNNSRGIVTFYIDGITGATKKSGSLNLGDSGSHSFLTIPMRLPPAHLILAEHGSITESNSTCPMNGKLMKIRLACDRDSGR